MNMAPWEIVASYKGASDQTVQRRILAELNECTVGDIDELLCLNGVHVNKSKPKNTWRKVDPNKVATLARLGLTDAEIAAELGCSESGVCYTRNTIGIQANYGQLGRNRKRRIASNGD